MNQLNKTFHLTPFEKNINQKANINWDDTITYLNDRNSGVAAWDDIRWLHYGCRVYNNANISIATSGVSQALTFNSERYDNFGIHSTSSNTSRLTAPRSGIYNIFGHVEFASNATGQRYIVIYANGTTNIAVEGKTAMAGGLSTFCSVSTMYSLAAGEYVELLANQTSGGALNVLSTASMSPEFGMMYVGE